MPLAASPRLALRVRPGAATGQGADKLLDLRDLLLEALDLVERLALRGEEQ